MSVGTRDTVCIDESVHEIYKLLTEGADPISAPFRTMKDLFLWAACLGFRRERRKKIDGKKVTIFRIAQFNQEIDLPLIKSIALAETGDLNILLDREMCLTIVEEYANGALHSLSCFDQRQGGSTLYKIVENIKNTER